MNAVGKTLAYPDVLRWQKKVMVVSEKSLLVLKDYH